LPNNRSPTGAGNTSRLDISIANQPKIHEESYHKLLSVRDVLCSFFFTINNNNKTKKTKKQAFSSHVKLHIVCYRIFKWLRKILEVKESLCRGMIDRGSRRVGEDSCFLLPSSDWLHLVLRPDDRLADQLRQRGCPWPADLPDFPIGRMEH
jgi:hypothetical protein